MKIWGAESDLVITSPYLIPGPMGITAFEDLGQRKVKTVVLTNSLAATDEPLVHTGYARYRTRLLRIGRGPVRDQPRAHAPHQAAGHVRLLARPAARQDRHRRWAHACSSAR